MKRVLPFLTFSLLVAYASVGHADDTNVYPGSFDSGSASAVPAASSGSNYQQQIENAANVGYQHVKDTAEAAGAEISAAAHEAGDHAENLGGAIKDRFYSTTDHVADWLRPDKPKPPQPISASYCYSVYQDILCYRRPMPGWETRLVGYQPLGAPPPKPAMMQPLPKQVVDANQLPANRAANAKPVFKELPQTAEAEKPAEDTTATPATPAVPDASHEQLPDPALAPQL